MKLLPLLAGCSLLGASSCALSTDKPKEEAKAETNGNSIPPPKNLQASNTTPVVKEELPELPLASVQDAQPTEKIDVKEIDGFKFRNVLDELPTQRDLASPPISSTPSSSIKDEGTRRQDDETEPLVANP